MPDYMRRLEKLTRDKRTNPGEVPLASAIECDAGYIVGVGACEVCGATDDEFCRGPRRADHIGDATEMVRS